MLHQKKVFKIDRQQETLSLQVQSILNTKDKEVERRIFDGDGQLKLKINFIYQNNDLLEKTLTFGSKGNILSTVQLTYDASNRLIKRSFYDGKKALLAYHQWEYDPQTGHLLKQSKIGKNGLTKFLKVFQYDSNGNLTEEKQFSSEGEIIILKKKNYDQKNREQSELIFEKGTLLKAKKLILYDSDDRPSEISWYDPNGHIQRLECFDYDPNGTLLNEIVLDFFANQSFFRHYSDSGKIEYVLKKQDFQPVAEEVFKYDTLNRLKSRTRFIINNGQKSTIEKEVHSYED